MFVSLVLGFILKCWWGLSFKSVYLEQNLLVVSFVLKGYNLDNKSFDLSKVVFKSLVWVFMNVSRVEGGGCT